jgi:Tfp pilus assembly protein PilO
MTPRKMNYVLKGMIVLLLIVTGVGLYFANQKLTSTASETSKLKAQVEIGQKQLKTYEATKAKVDSLDYVEDLASKVLPQEQEQSLTVAELSQFATRSRLAVSEITFAETGSKSKTTKSKTKTAIPKGVTVIPLTIKFKSGSKFDYLLEFLKSVEENRRKMQVTNISLTPNETDRSLLESVSVDINLYVRDSSSTEKKQ